MRVYTISLLSDTHHKQQQAPFHESGVPIRFNTFANSTLQQHILRLNHCAHLISSLSFLSFGSRNIRARLNTLQSSILLEFARVFSFSFHSAIGAFFQSGFSCCDVQSSLLPCCDGVVLLMCAFVYASIATRMLLVT